MQLRRFESDGLQSVLGKFAVLSDKPSLYWRGAVRHENVERVGWDKSSLQESMLSVGSGASLRRAIRPYGKLSA